jgi:putative addiction module component (TIGR02574 family)
MAGTDSSVPTPICRQHIGGESMAPSLQDLGLDRLPAEERLEVAEALWDSVARDIENTPLSAAQRAELERRLADSIARPGVGTPWEEVKARALARART